MSTAATLSGHLCAWVASWYAHELAHDLPRGRVEVDRETAHAAWIDAAAKRRAAYEAPGMDAWFAVERECDEVRGLLDHDGRSTVFGLSVRCVGACDPPIRYVPWRDPLLFGASA